MNGRKAKARHAATEDTMVLRLDLGCGVRKQPGFIGVDILPFEGVDVVLNIGHDHWPWPDGSIDEAYASHFVEHLEPMERVHFVNELYRVLRVGGKATLIVPSWTSQRAYGDLTHKWPPVVPFWFYYLSKKWREGEPGKPETANAPHNNFYTCDFEASWGAATHASMQVRSMEFQQFAIEHYLEAVQDFHATLTKRAV